MDNVRIRFAGVERSGIRRRDRRETISMLRKSELEAPLQFQNFRD